MAHGLPWVSDDVASRSDPFILRWRAIHGKLASREALSLCIRSCVMLRGFDYFAMSMEKGEYPWGESDKLTDARKWLASQLLDQATADYLRGILPELQGRKEELSDEEVQEWEHDIATRLQKGKEEGIEKMLRITRAENSTPAEPEASIFRAVMWRLICARSLSGTRI